MLKIDERSAVAEVKEENKEETKEYIKDDSEAQAVQAAQTSQAAPNEASKDRISLLHALDHSTQVHVYIKSKIICIIYSNPLLVRLSIRKEPSKLIILNIIRENLIRLVIVCLIF